MFFHQARHNLVSRVGPRCAYRFVIARLLCRDATNSMRMHSRQMLHRNAYRACGSVARIQKFNFRTNWTMRGLLLVEMMRPKLPALTTWPVVGSMLPAEATRAFRLLMGLAKFG